MNSKWYWYTRGTIHPYRADIGMLGVKDYASKLNLAPLTKGTVYINIGDKLYWGWPDDQIRQIGHEILRYCSKPANRIKHFKKVGFYTKNAIETAERFIKTDLGKLKASSLVRLYDQLISGIAPAHGFLDVDIDAVDVVLENFLMKLIKKSLRRSLDKSQFLKLYKGITAPIYESYLAKQEKDVIKIALKKKISSVDVDRLFKKYWWTNLGWENITPHRRDYFVRAVAKYRKYKHLTERYDELLDHLRKLKKTRRELIKKYNLKKSLVYWLEFIDKYALFHDYRKEMQVKTIYSLYHILPEISRRYGYKISDLEWSVCGEVRELLLGKKFNRVEITRRKKAVSIVVDDEHYWLSSGSKVLQLARYYLGSEKSEEKELRGTPVTHGRVSGVARVCSGAAEALRKVKKGDVLICGMTLPDYVPAMRLAAAIVTNEGGVTSHAAIISRELGKVCIVGTKKATQVFKDGDKVEVDANKGLVRKLDG